MKYFKRAFYLLGYGPVAFVVCIPVVIFHLLVEILSDYRRVLKGDFDNYPLIPRFWK